VTSGLLSVTGFGRLGFIAEVLLAVCARTPRQRAPARRAVGGAFVSVRNAIGSAPNLEPLPRAQLLDRIDRVDVNPIERSWDQEIRDGWRQYNALMNYAHANGLNLEVARDRGDEMRAMVHHPVARAFFHVASIVTAGPYVRDLAVLEGLICLKDEADVVARVRILSSDSRAAP
jgi:hypothetical protein